MLPQVLINGQTVPFSQEIPAEMAELRLHNSKAFYASGKYGYIFIQYVGNYGFGAIYITALLEEMITVSLALPQASFFCLVNLAQSFNILGPVPLHSLCRRNSLLLAFSSLATSSWQFPRGEHRGVIAVYPVPFAKKFLFRFPALESVRERVKAGAELIIPNMVRPLFASLSHCIHEILHIPRTFFTEQYYQANMRELLKLVCQEAGGNLSAKPLSTLSDIDSIKEAKEWLDINLDKPITIADLSRKIGINEFKLKKGFKELYAKGVHAYHLHQRLEAAKRQLGETNLPIREIARRIGYHNRNNFSAAFKRMFGITPIQYRRQSQP